MVTTGGLRALTVAAALVAGAAALPARGGWSPEELETLRSLWIGSLEPPPPDPTNRWADDPRAAALGERLFFDARLSVDGTVSCGTCHDPARGFQDGLPLGRGVGRTDRRTMPVEGTQYAPFLFWDGRKDSPWAQALGPLESPVEHGGSRALYAHVVAEAYRPAYEGVFGSLPDELLARVPRHAGPVPEPAARAAWEALGDRERDAVTGVFVNVGKAIAAFERTLLPAPSRFDRYVAALLSGTDPVGTLTHDEEKGLRLFVGKGQCTRCHNGPLLTDQHFHNTGVPEASGLPSDPGRARGAPAVLADEFNCRSRWSDAPGAACRELDFLAADGPELLRAFKTPSLRGVAGRPPYMHAGQIATLDEVVAHYDRAPRAPAGRSELERLRLSREERRWLAAFLGVLE